MPIAKSRGAPLEQAVLFVHGTPGDHRVFHKLLSLSPPGVLAAAMDLPDHGEAPDEGLEMAPFEEDLVRCVESLSQVPLTLVGSSFGAHVIARVLARLGPRVRRAVFMGGFAVMPGPLADMRTHLADQLESGELTRAGLESLAVDLFLGGEGSNDDADVIRSTIRDFSQPRLLRSIRRTVPLRDAIIPPFDTPTIVMHARDDQALPYNLAAALATCGTRTKVLPIEGRSHLPAADPPRRCRRGRFRILTGQAPPSAVASVMSPMRETAAENLFNLGAVFADAGLASPIHGRP